MKYAIGLDALLTLACGNVAAQVGVVTTWVQTSSTAGDCATCEITIEGVSNNILQLKANTGWIGYAYYVQPENKFYGAFEFTDGQFENVVILSDLTIDGQTLTLNAKSAPLSFKATYRPKK